MGNTIKTLLEARDVQLLDSGQQYSKGDDWARTARYLAEHYTVFDPLRVRLNQACDASAPACHAEGSAESDMLQTLHKRGVVSKHGSGYRLTENRQARVFLTGGWLEWMTREVLLAAGADEALCCQKVEWRVGNFKGRNEIDAIGRKGERLVFVSCKAAKAVLQQGSQYSRLMSYLHEADNLDDHFGRQGDQAVLVVATDLIDEARSNRARYPALFGKAKVLNVHLVTLEDLEWNRFVARARDLIKTM